MPESFYEVTRKRTTEYLDRELFSPNMTDIAYGDGADELLDIYYPPAGKGDPFPQTGGKYPVIVHIHGGGWVYGDKSMAGTAAMLRGFLDSGFAVASVRYSLAPGSIYPVQCCQVAEAVQFLKENGEKYGLRGDNVFLFGNSAGGFLALTAALGGELTKAAGIKAAAIIYGISHPGLIGTQLRALGLEGRYLTEVPESMEGLFFGADVREICALTDAASPLNTVSADCPPLLLQHGKEDRTVPYLQSSTMAEAVNRVAPGRAKLELFEELDHSAPFFKSRDNALHIAEFYKKHIT